MENSPLERPNTRDLRLHALSLEIAAIHREFHEMEERDQTACDELLTAFRLIRHRISTKSDGKRWGHYSAYLAMQGLAE